MEKFLYLTWQEDYESSIDEDRDPQQFGNFGDYWLNIIKGCGLEVRPSTLKLLNLGVGGIKAEDIQKTEASDEAMSQAVGDQPMLRLGRELLRIYLLDSACVLS